MTFLKTTMLMVLATLLSISLSAQCSFYYADLKYGGPNEKTDIFSVSLSGTDAILTPLVSAGGLFHIAFDENTGLLYLFHEKDSYFTTYDVVNGTFGSDVYTSPALKKISGAAFSPTGKLVVGDQVKGAVYEIDVNSGAASLLLKNKDINDGDLMFSATGELLMTSNKKFSTLNNLSLPPKSTLVGRLPENLVNGSVLTPTGTILASFGNSFNFIEIDPATGSAIGPHYNATLNGQPYRLNYDGDMASGCMLIIPPTPVCADFETFFLSFETSAVSNTDIYGVDISGGNANLTLLGTMPNHKLHGAYNEADGLLYTVSETDGNIYVFDPQTGSFSNMIPTALGPGTSAVAIKDSNTLVVGLAVNFQEVYYVDLNTGASTFFTNAPVFGGDLFYDLNGNLFLASNSSVGSIFSISPTGVVTPAFNLVYKVTGAAVNAYGNYLTSTAVGSGFVEYDDAGAVTGTYNTLLNGSPFSLQHGDLASGCAFTPPAPTPTCANFSYFMADFNQGVTSIYGVTLGGGTADLTLVTTVSFRAQIAYDVANGLIYLVGSDNTPRELYTYNLNDGVLTALPAITGIGAVGPVSSAGMSSTGELYVGADSENKLYIVDLTTGVATFVANVPFAGGDILFSNTDEMYVVSAENDQLIKVNTTTGTYTIVGMLPDSTTGGALTSLNEVLVLFKGVTSLQTFDLAGNAVDTYALQLNGAAFTPTTGDLASGCSYTAPPTPICQDFQYYLVDHTQEANVADRTTNLYGVTPGAGTADLTLLTNIPFRAQIAYSAADGLVYLIGSDNTPRELYTYNPVTGALVALPSITGIGATGTVSSAGMSSTGELYVGADSENKLYSVDLSTGVATFVANVPLTAGDILFSETDELYVVSNENDQLMKVNTTTGTYSTVSMIPNNSIGGALTALNEVLVLFQGGTSLQTFDLAGNAIDSYALELNGAAFTPFSGDLASGCGFTPPPTNVGCQDFRYYLVDHTQEANRYDRTTNLYGVGLNGSDADLTLIVNLPFRAQMAYNNADGLIYLVGSDNKPHELYTYNPANGDLVALTPFTGPVGPISSAGMNSAGELYVGARPDYLLYKVDIAGGTATAVANVPMIAGDIVFSESDEMYAVSDANDQLMKVDTTTGNFTTVGMIANTSIGAALTDSNEVIVLFKGSNALRTYDLSGNAGDVYSLKLNGSAFIPFGGDLASGCAVTPPTTSTCSNYAYFLSRNTTGSEIYGVTLNGADAELTLLATNSTPTHIAFNDSTSELYIVSNAVPVTVQTYNTLTNVSGPVVTVPGASAIVQVAYNETGLYIGSDVDDAIYLLDPATGATSAVASMSIAGGDLTFDLSGNLISASNASNTIVQIGLGGAANTTLANFSGTIVGLTSMADSNLLASFKTKSVLDVLDASGNPTGTTYNLTLNGAPFVQNNGDLASGCGSFNAPTNKRGGVLELGITEDDMSSLSMYPNPAMDNIHVKYTNENTTIGVVEVKIYNTIGQLVHQSQYQGEVNADINVSNLNFGLHIVNITVDGELDKTEKLFIVE